MVPDKRARSREAEEDRALNALADSILESVKDGRQEFRSGQKEFAELFR